jgi:hypothetical protein
MGISALSPISLSPISLSPISVTDFRTVTDFQRSGKKYRIGEF